MALQRLNQVIAVESGTKSRTETFITGLYHIAQKPALFSGMTRIYKPLDAGGERLPPETALVQQRADTILKGVQGALTELFDVAAARDWGNTVAKADIVVDGEVLLEGVPATYLLFLEKKLVDLHTIISKLPQLDPAETWAVDPNDGLYKTRVTETARTVKTPRALVAVPATKEHPAQTHIYNEDVIVGYYEAVKMSGALPPAEASKLLRRVQELQKAVKYAREQANMAPAAEQSVGAKIFAWLTR